MDHSNLALCTATKSFAPSILMFLAGVSCPCWGDFACSFSFRGQLPHANLILLASTCWPCRHVMCRYYSYTVRCSCNCLVGLLGILLEYLYAVIIMWKLPSFVMVGSLPSMKPPRRCSHRSLLAKIACSIAHLMSVKCTALNPIKLHDSTVPL